MSEILDLSQEKLTQDPAEAFALDVLMGLTSEPKELSPKYMYDKKGSELFEEVMCLEEYYPTRCETEILKKYRKEIVNFSDSDSLRVVELGAGNGQKTKILLEELLKTDKAASYIPVDISSDAVEGLINKLEKDFPKLKSLGLVGEYFEAIRWMNGQGRSRNLVLFLGSNIGNFSRAHTEVFMKTLWNVLNPGDLVLIGFDLKKDLDMLWHAYNDSKGVTRSLNLNVLERINRELGGNFNLSQFEHLGAYNVQSGAMESYLISKVKQEVDIEVLNKRFNFKPYESIHMEYSYKYLPEEIEILAQDTGFEVERRFYDENHYFVDTLLKVKKDLV